MSAVLADTACFHCGLPVPARSSWQVTIADVPRAMCCPGCAAVGESIVGSGFGDYYTSRSAYAAPARQELVPPELLLYDRPDALAGDAGADAVFSVEGIRCAACIWLIERRLARIDGVLGAEMNVATERLYVRWDGARCKPSEILAALRAIGYAAYPYDPVRHGEQLERARKRLFRQLFIAGLSMMQVMMYALPVYLATDGTMDADMTALMRWAALLLTLPAVTYSAQPFFRGAWNGIRSRLPGMDVPVALGIAAAFIGSVVATVQGSGEVYFDSVTMFIFLLLGSRYLELGARRRAALALAALQHALPASANRLAGWPNGRSVELVAAADLREGDHILVKAGEAIAADGVIVEGATEVDLSLLTGESLLQPKAVGAILPGGAVNSAQAIVLRVTRAAGESTLSMLVKLVERAGQGKPQLALWADRVAVYFVAGLLLLTVAVFIGWQLVDPARAWQAAVAVLVVSCPCALSLATPTALAATTDRLVRAGVLVVQPHVLETLQRATHIVFDKTGTLTVGHPVLRHLALFGLATRRRVLRVAAALEASSAHPLASAIIDAAGAMPPEASHVRQVAGCGVEARVDFVAYRLGSAAFVAELAGGGPPAGGETGTSAVYLGSSGSWLARFDLADAVRDDAAEVVGFFKARGKQVLLLSGDEQGVTDRIAAQLGIDGAYGNQLPEQKLAFVKRLQESGAVVAMVGDGINDAAVLRGADVSFAMGGGAALAQLHADCVLLSGRLSSLCDAASSASRTLAVIRQNLAWAMVYNVVAIPAAAAGLLNPWLSGVGMSLSSAVVVLNAIRLRRGGR